MKQEIQTVLYVSYVLISCLLWMGALSIGMNAMNVASNTSVLAGLALVFVGSAQFYLVLQACRKKLNF